MKLFAKSPDGTRGELFIRGELGAGGITAARVRGALAALQGVAELAVRIDSPGGDVPEAKAIYEALRAFPARRTTYVTGGCESVATVIALSSPRVVTAPGAKWLVHDCTTTASGNAAFLARAAEELARLNRWVAEVYAERTGRPVEEMLRLMAGAGGAGGGYWLTAEQAAAFGFTEIGVAHG